MKKTYDTAHDFWKDLKRQFCRDAKIVAFAYLDTVTAQTRRKGYDDAEELIFCCELFRLVSEDT